MRKFASPLWRFTLSSVEGLPRSLAIRAIGVYQATLSPDHGPLKHLYPLGYCPHEPTCSDYGRQVISERGLIRGGILLMKRLLSCHPWTKPHPERIRKAILKASQGTQE
ncbi:MAG: membrane protein insertion efficiency factor YidD [Candidatus Peregrinibacteria bacterium]